MAEKAVRRVKEGTAIAPVELVLPEEWWDCATKSCCYMRNVHDKMADDKTAFEKRYGQKFDGPIPFGSLVECIPMTAKDKERAHQLGKATLNGLFLGYVLRAERGVVRRLDDSRL